MEDLFAVLAKPQATRFLEFLVLHGGRADQGSYREEANIEDSDKGTISGHVGNLRRAGLVRKDGRQEVLVDQERTRLLLLHATELAEATARERATHAAARAKRLRNAPTNPASSC